MKILQPPGEKHTSYLSATLEAAIFPLNSLCNLICPKQACEYIRYSVSLTTPIFWHYCLIQSQRLNSYWTRPQWPLFLSRLHRWMRARRALVSTRSCFFEQTLCILPKPLLIQESLKDQVLTSLPAEPPLQLVFGWSGQGL